ncbi:dihydroxyacetone kinase operon transcriptional regulator DhaR [Vibrio sp. SCSIO 43137]|uniref:dihydroxyacetone kinase operon transcriptional regulator DhaR n=1 Tax=Vibrio sp. SCSIO 43137 TaxID=3021011 RepID=UPI0023080397|nr:dihydroxyacetone kinase operon transcriptional regulator DhaR [Vibrio sp. SCSIO 43137]WCE31727.1 dihydroxyacetone kinase operon transcriptional regulator DhaR [Vibrio sp. SCSIO 43137]
MNSSAIESRLTDTQTRWDFFQKHHWVAPQFSSSPILESWERCLRQSNAYEWHKPHIASGTTLESFNKRNLAVTCIAEAVLEDAYEYMESRHCCFLVTDETGCTMSILGHPELLQELSSMGISKGSFWSEGRLGTNAINLCLQTHETESIFAAEHFNTRLHGYSGHASPVFDEQGRARAALMIFTRVNDHKNSDASLINSCAKEVASQLLIDKTLTESNQILCQRNAVLECMDDGVVSWDKDERITFVNQVASEKLKLNKDKVLYKPFREMVTLPPALKNGWEQRKKISHVDVIIECQGDFIEVLATLRPLSDGGCLLFIHPLETIRRLAQRQLGANADLSFDSLVAHSKKMKQVITLAKRAAKVKDPVLLRGESGVGKGQIAMALHNYSQNSEGPFLTVNCKSIAPENMLRTLFGTDEGEGAASKFELANGGTLYLEQVEYLSEEAQSALLQMLKTNILVRDSSSRMIPVNFQLITSTNVDLEQYVSKHNFRRQLYYAIGAIELMIPPLRQRKEDIPAYVDRQIKRMKKRFNVDIVMSEPALEALCGYSWPGNIAELQNKVEKIVLNRRRNLIDIDDLPSQLLSSKSGQEEVYWGASIQSLEELERKAIKEAWEVFDGRINDIAAALKIGRTTLWRKLKKYEINKDDSEQEAV